MRSLASVCLHEFRESVNFQTIILQMHNFEIDGNDHRAATYLWKCYCREIDPKCKTYAHLERRVAQLRMLASNSSLIADATKRSAQCDCCCYCCVLLQL